MTAAGVAQGRVGLVIWDQFKVWILESMRFHSPSVVRCEVVTNRKRYPIIGAYLPLSTLEHLSDLEEALPRFHYQYYIVLG